MMDFNLFVIMPVTGMTIIPHFTALELCWDVKIGCKYRGAKLTRAPSVKFIPLHAITVLAERFWWIGRLIRSALLVKLKKNRNFDIDNVFIFPVCLVLCIILSYLTKFIFLDLSVNQLQISSRQRLPHSQSVWATQHLSNPSGQLVFQKKVTLAAGSSAPPSLPPTTHLTETHVDSLHLWLSFLSSQLFCLYQKNLL